MSVSTAAQNPLILLVFVRKNNAYLSSNLLLSLSSHLLEEKMCFVACHRFGISMYIKVLKYTNILNLYIYTYIIFNLISMLKQLSIENMNQSFCWSTCNLPCQTAGQKTRNSKNGVGCVIFGLLVFLV